MSKIFKNELSDYKMTMGQLKSIQYNNPWSDDIAKYEFIDFDLKPENLIKKGGIRVSYPYHSAMDIMGTKIKFPFNEESPDNFKPDDTIVNEKFDKLDRKNTKRRRLQWKEVEPIGCLKYLKKIEINGKVLKKQRRL